MLDLGTVLPGSTIRIPFSTFDKDDGSSITMTNFAAADILIYKDGSTTERASTSGYTATTDFDTKTGKHLIIIDLADNTTADFYAAGSEYLVALDSVTVDTVTVGGWLARFKIGVVGAILDTTIATLASQTSFTLTAGSADDNSLVGCTAVIHDAASAVQKALGVVSAYTGTTKTVTLAADPAVFTMAAKDNISFLPPVNVKWWATGVVPTPTVAGVPNVNTKTINDVATTAVTTIKAVQGLAVDGVITTLTNLPAITTDWISAAGVSAAAVTKIQTGLATPTNITAGTITTTTNLTNLPSITAGWLTATGIAADAITAAKIADGAIDAATFAADVDAEILSYIVDDATRIDASALNTATVTTIPAILDDTGTTGVALSSTAVTAIWDAGNIDGYTYAGALSTIYFDTVSVLADTNELQTDWVNGGRLDLILDARASQTSVDTIDDFLDTEIAAIKAKTDQFVFTVAGQVDANALSGGGGLDAAGVRTAIGLATANLDTQLSTIDDFLDTEVAAILAAVDTEVAAIKTVTDAIGTTGSGLSAIPWNASWDAEVQSEVDDALVAQNLDHLVKIAVDTNFATTVHLDSVIGQLVDNGTTATYDRTTDSQEAIRDRGDSAWTTATGFATSSALATAQTSIDDIPTNAELATALGTADDATLAAIAALNNLSETNIRTAVGLASANLDTQLTTIDDFLDTEIAAIKAKTDNLPTDPADASDISSAFGTVNSTLSTIAGYIDTEVSAIKTKTDQLTFTVANQVDSNVLTGGGSGMTASETRAALGLASANLDTQLGDLPTNAELATALGTADDAVLAAVAALNNLSAAGVRTAIGLATANLDTQLSTIDDFLDTEVAAIKAKTDLIPSDPADASDIAALIDALPTAAENAAALLDYTDGVETSVTLKQALRLILAASAGKLSGAATTTITIRNVGDTKDRIIATVDSSGNRSAITTDLT